MEWLARLQHFSHIGRRLALPTPQPEAVQIRNSWPEPSSAPRGVSREKMVESCAEHTQRHKSIGAYSF